MTHRDLLEALGEIDPQYLKSLDLLYKEEPLWRCIMKKSVKFAVTAVSVVLTLGVIAIAMFLQSGPEVDGPAGNEIVSATEINMEKPPVEDPRPISCEEEVDGEPVVILTERRFAQGTKELENCYTLLKEGDSPNILFEFLPEDPTARDARITSLKTEIMAGKGPDAFLLSSYIALASELQPLFNDPESAMRSGFFLPLNDLINESDIINMSNVNTTVFDAGKLGNVQYMMPLLYNIGIAVVNADDLAVDSAPSSWQEVLDCKDEKLKSTMMGPAFVYPGNTFPSLADYENGRLTFSQEELLTRIQEIAAGYDYGERSETVSTFTSSQLCNPLLSDLEASKAEEHAFLPLPNEDGGITANITAFAAVNANAKHPRAAFSVLETLFREELLTYDGITRMNYSSDMPYAVHYGPNFYSVSMMALAHGISVMDKAFLDSDSFHISQEDRGALKQCFDRINHAHFTSRLDSELCGALIQIVGADADLEETVAQTYAALQMMLAES